MTNDKIRGSLIGGAAGDALGYPVEFMDEVEIFSKYGENGITEYELTHGKAEISDDTQMTLFTANALLFRETRGVLRGIAGKPRSYIARAYQDWLCTQEGKKPEDGISWLQDVPELYSRRAPGMTCQDGLEIRSKERGTDDYIARPINHSKGCGGIMRIAPVALSLGQNAKTVSELKEVDLEAAQAAAITHSHSLGYMPAAVAAHVISRCLTSADTMTLKEMVLEARDTAKELFAGDEHLAELTEIIDKAVRLSENELPDLDNIHALGKGWVAEETLAIALYCALRYPHDLSKAIIAAVNHDGDSDSTGAVTGNILGALLGYEAMLKALKSSFPSSRIIRIPASSALLTCTRKRTGTRSLTASGRSQTRKWSRLPRPFLPLLPAPASLSAPAQKKLISKSITLSRTAVLTGTE